MHRARTNRAHRAEFRRRSSFKRTNSGRFRPIPLIRHEFRDRSKGYFRSPFALPGGVNSCLPIRPAGTALSRIGSKAFRSNGKTRADEFMPEPENSERESTRAVAIQGARFPMAGAFSPERRSGTASRRQRLSSPFGNLRASRLGSEISTPPSRDLGINRSGRVSRIRSRQSARKSPA